MEALKTPKEYRELLIRLGGINPYGEPNYILHWGGSPVVRVGVPDTMLAPYLNVWCLSEWKPAEDFGSPDLWDEELYGPYPNRGMYLPLQVFKEEGKPIMLDTEGLNPRVVELFMWVILNYKNDSLMKRETYLKDEYAQAEAAKRKRICEQIEDGAPAFLGPTSFIGQTNVNSVILQKMEQLQRNLSRIQASAARFSRGGIQQGPAL